MSSLISYHPIKDGKGYVSRVAVVFDGYLQVVFARDRKQRLVAVSRTDFSGNNPPNLYIPPIFKPEILKTVGEIFAKSDRKRKRDECQLSLEF